MKECRLWISEAKLWIFEAKWSKAGDCCFQMMVLLSGALRDSPTGAKLQALEGWLLLLRALAQHAPTHLGGMANQVAHSACNELLPVLPDCLTTEGTTLCMQYLDV